MVKFFVVEAAAHPGLKSRLDMLSYFLDLFHSLRRYSFNGMVWMSTTWCLCDFINLKICRPSLSDVVIGQGCMCVFIGMSVCVV